MTAQGVLNMLKARGIRVEPRPNGTLHVAPKCRLTPDLIEMLIGHKAEIIAALAYKREHEDEAPSAPSLVVIADAIASAPRSPFLDDLAIARTARALVEVDRTTRDAPPSIRVEVASIARDALKQAADAIRAKRYASAYDLLDNLAAKMREMRTH